jgi:competence protein ComFC
MAKQLMVSSLMCLTAVPLHPRRQRRRGFNQAEVIATTLSAQWHVPCIPLLVRSRFTKPQAQLSEKADRFANIADNFSLSPQPTAPLPAWWLDPKAVLAIVDDVTTTGATLEECARTLQTAGFAGHIIGLAVAHGK